MISIHLLHLIIKILLIEALMFSMYDLVKIDRENKIIEN